MKNHILSTLFVATAATCSIASAASFTYKGLNYTEATCTTKFVINDYGMLSCSTSTQPATSAPVCSITQNPTFSQNGAPVTILSNCSASPNNPTSYSWTLAQLTPTVGNATTVSTTQNYMPITSLSPGTYMVTLHASNAKGAATGTLTTTLTVTAPAITPPSGDTLCTQAGLSNTEMPLNWTKGTYQNINIGLNQSVSFPLTLPAASSGGRITMSYTSGGTEVISISRNKCDFSPSLLTTQCMVAGSSPNLTFQPAGSSYSNCALTPGVQYYVNVRNAAMSGRSLIFPIVDSCTSGGCYGVMSYMY
jgi:hypothetical protein